MDPTIADAFFTPSEEDRLLEEGLASRPIKTAAYGLAGAGFLVATVGLQTLLIGGQTIVKVCAYAMLIGGVLSIALSTRLMRGKAWTLSPAIALALVLSIGSGTFFVWSFTQGVVSLLALLAVGGGLTAAILVGLAIGPFGRMLRARKTLRERGIDVAFDF